MRTSLDCIPCIVGQAVESVRLVTKDTTIQRRILNGVLRATAEMDSDLPPPAAAQQIHRMIRRVANCDDPYHSTKAYVTAVLLAMYPDVAQKVEHHEDPFEAAVRMAIAGNVMGMGTGSAPENPAIRDAIAHAWTAPLHGDLWALRNAAHDAGSILYLADKAGEMVLDRLLIDRLGPRRVTVVVRGAPILDDATVADAERAGLLGRVEVIDNGSDAPGTILADCSETFSRRFDRADLVIAKGQGNYETLSDAARRVFFLLKVECPPVARDFGCNIGSLALRRSDPLRRS